jgi:hypothetical protein
MTHPIPFTKHHLAIAPLSKIPQAPLYFIAGTHRFAGVELVLNLG